MLLLLIPMCSSLQQLVHPPMKVILSDSPGNQTFGKGVFAEKRRKLHQRAVDTLFPELGEGCSQGFDMVSKLLNRLFPKGCENDDTMLVERTMDATDHLSTLSTSYSSQKKVHLVHKNTSMDLENDSSFVDIFPTYFHGITKKDLASEREDSLAIYDTGANFLEYEADPQLIGRYQKCNSSSWFPYEKMRTKSFYIQELDDYTDPSKSRKREPQNFLLDWDFEREKEKDELHLPSRDVEDCTYSALSISRIGQKQQFIGDRLDEIAFPSLSFPRICPKYDVMPYWQPNYFDTQNARRLLEYGHQEDLEPRESPSRLSLIPKYLTLAEDRGVHNVLECEDSPTLCFQDNPGCITDVSSHRPQHAAEALLLSGGLDIDMAWKCLSLSSPHGGRQLTSYCSSQFPQRELSTSYLPDKGEFDPGLHTSNSRKTNVLFSENAFTHQDCSITDILDRECHSLIDSSCWDEPYVPKEDDYN
ncbi:hypothetical protein Leryth_012567 [Lithospermum erythrorhizon]|nr:hypothetical protein Leryth_012567 [Lithospermum erythrorhizon]